MPDSVRETGSLRGGGCGMGFTRALLVTLPEELTRTTFGGGSFLATPGRGGGGRGLLSSESDGVALGRTRTCKV